MYKEILGTPQTPPWGCAPWTPAGIGGLGTLQTPATGLRPLDPLVEVMQ